MRLEWTLIAETSQVGPVVEALEEACGPLLAADKLYRLCLAADELLTNAVTHGKADAPIQLIMSATDEAVEIEVSDGGPPFDPFLQAPPPVLDAPLEERRLGGLGVHFVRTLSDQSDYRREGERNVTRVVMRR